MKTYFDTPVHSPKTSSSRNVGREDQEESMLWRSFKLGSQESFSKIYHRYFNELYSYGLKICSDENISKDCIQELFAHLWFSREKLGNIESIKFYLLKAYRRNLISYMKRNKEEFLSKRSFVQTQPNIFFSSEEFIIAEETFQIKKEHLSKILNTLPKRRREAIYLKYYRELTYEEIASMMNLTEKAVINHIYKAFKAIRKNAYLKSSLELIVKLILALLIISILKV